MIKQLFHTKSWVLKTSTRPTITSLLIIGIAFTLASCASEEKAIFSVGDGYSCAVLNDKSNNTDKQLHCWGNEPVLMTSNPSAANNIFNYAARAIKLPIDRFSLEDTASYDGHSCAIIRSVQLYCWGKNDAGQLGNGNTASTAIPQKFSIEANKISTGVSHTCAENAFGFICWGSNKYGQLGTGNNSDQRTPAAVQLPASYKIKKLALGAHHSCAIIDKAGTYAEILRKSDKAVFCWGKNNVGQLGLNDTRDRNRPQEVRLPNGYKPKNIAAGDAHTCVLTAAEKVFCWGDNSKQQLGIKGINASTSPRLVPLYGSTVPIINIDAGGNYTCAIILSTGIACWGKQKGANSATGPTTIKVPSDLEGNKISALKVSATHGCAISTKQMYCWGQNGGKQLGVSKNPPNLVTAVRPVFNFDNRDKNHTLYIKP